LSERTEQNHEYHARIMGFLADIWTPGLLYFV